MRSTGILWKTAGQELWPAGALVLGLGLSIAGMNLLLSPLRGDTFSPFSGSGPLAELPMLLAALWAGVAAAGGSAEEQVHWLARPVGRLHMSLIRVSTALGFVIGAGLLVHGLSLAAGQEQLLPRASFWGTLLYFLLCGMAGGILHPQRGPAMGLAFVMAPMVGPAPALLGGWLKQLFQADLATPPMPPEPWTMGLGCLILAVVIMRYWLRFQPLRSPRAIFSLGLWLCLGMASSVLVAGLYLSLV